MPLVVWLPETPAWCKLSSFMLRAYVRDDHGGLKIHDEVETGGAVAELTDGRGVLYPTKLPSFHRAPAHEDIDAWIRWFWVPRWELPPGRTSRQTVLPFPASNLVVQSDSVRLHGPTTGVSHQDLRGRGRAVGASLRPAGIASLHADPHGIKNSDRKSTRLNSSHVAISYAVFCLKKK